MTTIHTTDDLVRALREQPELLQAVRSLVLTDELLDTPNRVARLEESLQRLTERVDSLTTAVAALTQKVNEFIDTTNRRLAALESDVAELKSDVKVLKTDVTVLKTDVAVLKTDVAVLKTDVAELKTDVAVLKTDVAGLKTDVAGLKTDVKGLKDDMGGLKGSDLERRARESILNIAKDELGFTRGRVLLRGSGDVDPQLRAAIDQAEARGAVTESEVDNLLVADIIIRARRASDRQYVYAAIEVSRTIGNRDIERASDRAGTLAAVTDETTVAAVIGEVIQPPQIALAERKEVAVVLPAMFRAGQPERGNG